MSKSPTIRRSDFVRRLVKDAGLTYIKAEQVYNVTLRVLENAVAAKSSVSFGRLGALTPTELKPRKVVMGCKRSGGVNGGTMELARREYFLGVRTRYVFKLHRTFGRDHGIVP